MTNQDLRSIALSLNHPDAYFYDIQVGDESISGFFEGDETGIPFTIDFTEFLSSAYSLGFIASYDKREIWISDSYEGHAMRPTDYIQWAVEDRTEGQRVLRHAIECKWAEHISALAREISSGVASCSIKERIRRTVDTAFCDAVQELATIIEEVNREKEAA